MNNQEAWFFPDSYLREMEALVAAIYQVEGKTKQPDVKDVLLMAQAFGVYMRGQVDKAGSIQSFLKGVRKEGGPAIGRTELPNKRYYEFLRYVSTITTAVDEVGEIPKAAEEQVEAKIEVKVETGATDLAKVWDQLLDAYTENAPSTWPQMVRRPKLAKMGNRIQEGITHAGGADQFVALFASALRKTPDFYRNTYVRKGASLRPMLDCILCLLSGDKNHKELGVAGWRMFEWADLMDAGEAPKPGLRHPAEEYLSWTGTRWTYRRPDLDDQFLEEQRQLLIDAGLGPADEL